MLYFGNAARLIAVGTLSGAAVLGFGTATAGAETGKLMSMLPEGFSSSNCQEATPKSPAVEKVTCDQSTQADGPTSAVFLLYNNQDDLATGFKSANMTISNSCPGDQQSPGPWGYGSGAKDGGQVECGTTEGQAAVVWSDNSKLRVAAVTGSDINSLYTWWKQKSG